MIQRTYLIVAALGLIGLLACGEPASAQRVRMGVGVGSAPGFGAGPYRGFYGPYGPGMGYGSYLGSPYSYGGVMGGAGFYYYSPYNSPFYNYPYSYSYGPYTTPRYGFGGVGGQPVYMPPAGQDYAAPPQSSNAANIRVLVPSADAKVWFDGALTKQTGTDRSFHTPDLDPKGGAYSYRIRASWTADNQEVVQERVVDIAPGKTAVADFR